MRRALKVLGQQHSNIQIAILDVGFLYRDAINHPAKFGFANAVSGCLEGSRACTNPDQFLFWDGIHPTTAAHRILADAAYKTIQDDGIAEAP